MKVLMLSTDAAILRPGSEARRRMEEYGQLFDELHIVIAVKNTPGEAIERVSETTSAYRADSRWKLGAFGKVYGISEKILKTGGQWVITAQDPFENGLNAYWLSRQFKLPLQLQVHTDFLSPWFAKESLKNKIRVMIGKYLVRRAKGLRVVSERIRASLLRLSPKMTHIPITVLPITVNVSGLRGAPIQPGLREKFSQFEYILFLPARFTIEKNIAMAIEAMKIIRQSSEKKIGLLLAGDGPKRAELGRLIARYRLQDRVILIGWTSDAVSYYKMADAMLLTSNYEGGARAPSEAAAVGLPVIMTDVAPANEYIKNGVNGFVVPVGDCEKLAEKILALASDADLQARFRENTRVISDAFPTKEDYLRQYQASLKGLL